MNHNIEHRMEETREKFVQAGIGSRIVSGLVYLGIVICCIYLGGVFYFGLILFVSTVCMFELVRLLKIKSKPLIVFVFLIHLLLLVPEIRRYTTLERETALLLDEIKLLLYPAVILALSCRLFSRKENQAADVGKFALALVYISLPFYTSLLVPFTLNSWVYFYQIVLGVFILISLNDSFAYLTGVRFGRHRLAEHISPKKSMEGLAGGTLATFTGALVFSYCFHTPSLWQWLVIASIVSTMGVCGDLFESKIKREAGVKDSGKIMPGHGGLLDRFDSFIFSMPFIYVFLYVFQNF